MDTPKKDIRCQVCLTEFNKAELKAKMLAGEVEETQLCPACGTHLGPMLIKDDINIMVNWQELRILTILAKRYSREHAGNRPEGDARKSLDNIIEKLSKYKPADSPLPLMTEADLAPITVDQNVEIPEEFKNKLDDGSILSPFMTNF